MDAGIKIPGKFRSKAWTLFLVGLFVSANAWAAEELAPVASPTPRPEVHPPEETARGLLLAPPVTAFEGQRIGSIHIEGLSRTHETVVLRELLFQPGDTVNARDVAQSMQRLKNLRIFRTARARVVPHAAGEVDLVVEVEEKWTIIPVSRVGGGGGSAFFVIGAYDLNLAGRYLELGAQYENYNGIHGAAVWFRDPRFLDERQRLSFEGGWLGRPRALYAGNDGHLVGAYVQHRKRAFVALDREFHPALTLGLGVEFTRDTYGTQGLSAKEKRVNAAGAATDRVAKGFTARGLPVSERTVLADLRVFLGVLNLEDYLIDGALLESHLMFARPQENRLPPFARFTLQGSLFHVLPWRQNIGLRMGLGTTDARTVPDGFFIGGLEHVRGYSDGEFRGTRSWYLNGEYRVPSLQSRLVVLQHVVFFDTGDAAQHWRHFRPFSSHSPRSAGLGLRLIAPTVARFNVRLDYAATLTRRRSGGIVFGAQQFF